MPNCPDHEALSAYVDDEHSGSAPSIERHLVGCAQCRATVAEMKALNATLRQEARALKAPPRLVNWIERRRIVEEAKSRPARLMSRRAALLGGGALAGGATAATVALLLSSQDADAGLMAPTLFRDFATRVAADHALDIPSSDPATVEAWFDARLPFVAPRIGELSQISLRGGRLCWLLDRRVAAYHLGSGPSWLCLYVAQSDGLALTDRRSLPARGQSAAILRDEGAAGAFWTDGLAFALIGAAPPERIKRYVRALRGD